LGHFAPLRTWLFWKLATLWFWEVVLVAACLALGALVCKRALRDSPQLPACDRLIFVLASGVVAFAMLLYLAGAVALLRPAFAVGMPVLAIVAAWAWARPQIMSAVRELATVRVNATPLRLAILAFGFISIALIYLHILSPDALNHDAHWTHVVIAQDYAREGGIVPIYGGWTKNYPHLASVIYTWCYLVPGLDDQEKLLLIMHTEFVFFLGTLLAIGAAARWLTHERAPGYSTAWVAFFLFPSIFV
jgi:hypothetical protein